MLLMLMMLSVPQATMPGEEHDARGVGEVGRDEVGAATLQLDLFDRLHTARRVPAMHGDVGAIARELRRDRAAEPGRGSRDERSQAMQIALLGRSHHPSLFAPLSLGDDVERFLNNCAGFVSYCFGLCPR